MKPESQMQKVNQKQIFKTIDICVWFLPKGKRISGKNECLDAIELSLLIILYILEELRLGIYEIFL